MYRGDEKVPDVRLAWMVAAVDSVADLVPRRVRAAERSPVSVVPDEAASVEPRVAASNRTVELDAGVPSPDKVDSLDS